MSVILAGRYQIIQPLGSGGFSQTFLAIDNHLPGNPICVVKQLKPSSTTPESLQIAQRLFNLEAEILYRLGNHDQIPRLLAHFEQENEFYLVQEFVEGESLTQEFARSQPLPEAEVITFLKDILQVLVFVHAQGVIHRDIKPSNLMRRQHDRKIVLIDFGAVKQVSLPQLQASGQADFTVAIGSPGYMPIEQQLSQPCFSSDLYAVGMVAWQALTRLMPQDLPRDQQTGAVQWDCFNRLNLHPELAALLNQMVRYDYRQRYETAVEVLSALNRLQLNGETTVAPNPVTLESAAPDDWKRLDGDRNLTQPPLETVAPQPQHFPVVTANQPVAVRQVTSPVTRLSSREYRNRQALLNKVKNYWIKGVLEISLQDQVLIACGLEHRPDAVASPWNLAWQRENRPPKTLPPGTPIISIFDSLGTGRTLLILGEPGAGKTTTLLQLARDLIARAEQTVEHLIPIVLNLSSWSKENSAIADWVIEELNTKYQVPKPIGQAWVEQQQLLLLLDGLDEVQLERQEACVAALNTFQQHFSTEMVVCSRIKDYEALSNRLNFQSAIYLKALTWEQINGYLDSLSVNLSGLKTLLAEDAALQELARSPLMLNIMVLAYQGITTEQLRQTDVVEERRYQLFNAYIDRMFKRREGRPPYPKAQAIAWLIWLAQQMAQQSQTIFLIERIQPVWLKTSTHQWLYSAISGLVFHAAYGFLFSTIYILTHGFNSTLLMTLLVWFIISNVMTLMIHKLTFWVEMLPVSPCQLLLQRVMYSVGSGVIAGLIYNLLITLVAGPKLGLMIGLISGLLTGVIDILSHGYVGNHFHHVIPTETLKWSWQKMKVSLLFWMMIGAVGPIVLRFVGMLSGSYLSLLGLGLISGLFTGLIAGLGVGQEIETRTVPNQGIWRSAKNSLFFIVVGSIGLGLLAQLVRIDPYFGATFGAIVGLFTGGNAAVEHLILRMILYITGCMAWNQTRFLDYATQLTFLQKVGGGYIFIHRLLLEYFAEIQSENPR